MSVKKKNSRVIAYYSRRPSSGRYYPVARSVLIMSRRSFGANPVGGLFCGPTLQRTFGASVGFRNALSYRPSTPHLCLPLFSPRRRLLLALCSFIVCDFRRQNNTVIVSCTRRLERQRNVREISRIFATFRVMLFVLRRKTGDE